MASDSFVNHAGYRYLRLSLLLVVGAIAAYAWHDPRPEPHGGTWLGFTLGGIAAFIVLILLWLGIRKRRYYSRFGTVRGWLSAHIWLGLSLPVLATLHAGFQFHWNVHTLAYALTLLAVVTGVWGSVMYLRNPRLMAAQGEEQNNTMAAASMRELEEEALQLADRISPRVHGLIAAAFKSRSPPGRWARAFRAKPGVGDVEADRYFAADGETWQLESSLAEELAASRDTKRVHGLRDLLQTIGRRRVLSLQQGQDLRLQAQLQIWLLFHVPISVGLLAALIAHVISVFFYR